MVVELITFRLRPDVSEPDFLRADAAVQTDFYYQRPGLSRRTTAKSSDGEWMCVVLWGSEADARAAQQAAALDPVTQTFGEMLDHTSVRSKRYSALD